MNSYLQIKIDGQANSTYKKLRCVFGAGSYPYSSDQGRVINRTNSGKVSKQVGPNYKYWYGNFRVKWIEDVGYANIFDLNMWHTSPLPTNQRLVLRPHGWTGTCANHVAHVNSGGWTLTFADSFDWDVVAGQTVTMTGSGAVFTIIAVTSTQQVFPLTATATLVSGSPVSGPTSLACNITGDGVYEFNVTFTTGTDPQGMLPVMESSAGFMLVQFRMEERT